MNNAFYNLLYSAQQAIKNKTDEFYWHINDLPVYLWEVDPIVWGQNGLLVIIGKPLQFTEDELKEALEKLDELLHM